MGVLQMQLAASKANEKSRNPKKLHKLTRFLYDRLPVIRRLTEDELGTRRALPKRGTPLCEVRQLVADEFGKILTTQDVYNYRRKYRPGVEYKLCTFLITDSMCIGRSVMYAFVKSEQFAPMRKLFGLFREMMGEHYPLLRRTDPRFFSYLTARWLYITRKWAVHAQSGMVRFGNVTNDRLGNANGRLIDQVDHADTLERAIQKVSRHVEWLMREFELHTSYHCDGRQILVGDGYVLTVVCRMTIFFLSLLPNPATMAVGFQPTKKGILLTLVPKLPPTAFDNLRKELNRVMDKLQGLEPRKATASLKQLIVHGQTLLHQGSYSATDGLPSVVEDTAPQTGWRSWDTDLGFCVLCGRPTITSDRWCATDRVSYHADCCAGEPCPLCDDALQAYPNYEPTEE
ncbi:hypothetical protein CLF_100887 [Clonorchis sinensis]|uniref:Uncharacterized protein n=1 Tax=Clonorchis sinensis TaxID=79923 RepID=G7Y4H0_CLOSI|nr:hypothetical protein CLF_100887 [Clonorchis sinensis]